MKINTEALFRYITQGVYVISVDNGQQQNAFTAAWVMQVSFNPVLLCFSINPAHHSYPLLQEGSVCCISVLNNKQYVEAGYFGQSNIKDKMTGCHWLKTETGAPALTKSLAYFDCRVNHYSAAGDHILVICKVIDAVIINEGKPMLYSNTEDMDSSGQLYKNQ